MTMDPKQAPLETSGVAIDLSSGMAEDGDDSSNMSNTTRISRMNSMSRRTMGSRRTMSGTRSTSNNSTAANSINSFSTTTTSTSNNNNTKSSLTTRLMEQQQQQSQADAQQQQATEKTSLLIRNGSSCSSISAVTASPLLRPITTTTSNTNTNTNTTTSNAAAYNDDIDDDNIDIEGASAVVVARRMRSSNKLLMNKHFQMLIILSTIVALLGLGGFFGRTATTTTNTNTTTHTTIRNSGSSGNNNNNNIDHDHDTTRTTTTGNNNNNNNKSEDDDDNINSYEDSLINDDDDDDDDYFEAATTSNAGSSSSSSTSSSSSSTTTSKYKRVQYFGFQIYTGGAPAFLHDNNNNSTTAPPMKLRRNHECAKHTYGQVPLEDGINHIQCYVGHKDPILDVAARLRIMKDGVERAYQESLVLLSASSSSDDSSNSSDGDVLKIFAAPEFYFRGVSGAYDFSDDPTRLDKIFGYNHTTTTTKTKNSSHSRDVQSREMCSEGPVCAILQGLQDIVEDKRYEDWLFLFGTVVAAQQLELKKVEVEVEVEPLEQPVVQVDETNTNTNATTTTTTTTKNNKDHIQHDGNYEYLYYNFAPVYKGFDPNNGNNKNNNNNHNHHHPALGKRFLVNKRYVSTSDFLTPSRDISWIDRGSDWEELFGPPEYESQQDINIKKQRLMDNNNNLDDDGNTNNNGNNGNGGTGEWVVASGFDAADGAAIITDTETENTETDTKAVDNPRTYLHKRYDDDWFAAYKNQLYDKAGYVQVEYDWLIVDGITFSLEVCLDHQLRTALDTFNGDIVTGRTTKIPSSYSYAGGGGGSGIEYVSIPTHQAQIGLVSSAGMSPNTDSLALAQNGILFLQDGISNKTARRFVDQDLQQQCGPQQGLQFEGGTVAVRRRALVTNTDVRFEYELLSSSSSSSGSASASASSSSASSSSSTSSTTPAAPEETAREHKIPLYKNSDDDDNNNKDDSKSSNSWKTNLNGIFSTEVYEPHLVVYGPIDIAKV